MLSEVQTSLAAPWHGTIHRYMGLQDLENKALSRDIIGKSAPKLAEITIGKSHLFALKGVGTRVFYRWLICDYQTWFPQVLERTRLFRLFKTHAAWTTQFLATPIVLGVADIYGIEFIQPIHEGGAPRRLARKGRAISGGLLTASCVLS